MGTEKSMIAKLKIRNICDLSDPMDHYPEFSDMEKRYEANIPEEVTELYSLTSGGFVEISDGDNWRILSPEDISDASDDLGVDFIGLKKLPLIDCKDNDFICYDFKEARYEMFNIIDEIGFMEKDGLWDFFAEKLDS